MAAIRLLHLLNTLDDSSLSRLVLNLFHGLDKNYYKLYIGCLFGDDSLADEFREAGASVVNFAMQGYRDLGVISRVRDYICKHDIKVVHTHILRADYVAWFATRLLKNRCLVATKHNLGYAVGLENRRIRNLLYYLSLYMPDNLIAVSDWLRQRLIRFPGLDEERMITIHNGIDVDIFFHPRERRVCRQELEINEDFIVIGYAGRLVAGKGLEILIRVMPTILQTFPQARLMLVGAGPLRDNLLALVNKMSLSSAVIFTGFRTDVPRLLAAMDVFVLPSLAEGLPLSVIEAMAAQKPIIATPVGGVVELLEDEITGHLVSPNDAGALAAAILRMLDDRDLAERVGHQARIYVKKNFSLQRMTQEYDALYNDLKSYF